MTLLYNISTFSVSNNLFIMAPLQRAWYHLIFLKAHTRNIQDRTVDIPHACIGIIY
jgi:hypothetical protein